MCARFDIHMPDVSGWQVAQTVRARRQANRPLLIGISGVLALLAPLNARQ